MWALHHNAICLPATHNNTIYRHVEIYSYAYFSPLSGSFFFFWLYEDYFKSHHIYESMVMFCITYGTGTYICKSTWTLKQIFQNINMDMIKSMMCACGWYVEHFSAMDSFSVRWKPQCKSYSKWSLLSCESHLRCSNTTLACHGARFVHRDTDMLEQVWASETSKGKLQHAEKYYTILCF